MGEEKLKLDHIALASNSEEESDKFFISLLDMNKVRNFEVSNDKMRQFFSVNERHNFVRYENEDFSVEIVITNEKDRVKDTFTHTCISVKNGLKLIEKATSMGYVTIKVPRDRDDGYYLFLKDAFGNLFEIKETS
ncbi:MAG: hypothetical protein EU517_00320 [Promethearchaeota archaeon]|nr:MAG: hypothetical protein EU517_00320 [Candidatus Lokiarchaeota archaeon]